MSDLEVRDNPQENRYEAWVDDQLAGIAVYQRHDDRVVLTHTEVSDAYEGRGVGSALARGVLDDVRANGGAVDPQCSFMRGWIEKHPDYQDLVRQG